MENTLKDNAQIEAKRKLLKSLLQKKKTSKVGRETIVARGEDLQVRTVCSFAQQRLWLLNQIDGGSVHYNMSSALRLRGNLNKSALVKALNSIIKRHEVLRTNLVEDASGQVSQVIRASFEFNVAETDLTG